MTTRRSSRAYGLLLRLLPAAFRQRYGDEMRRMFEEEWAERGGAARVRLWLRSVRGVIWTAVVERLSPGYASPHGPSGGGFHGFSTDVRAALRSLGRRPGFAATAIATLGIGLGAATAVFSVVDATILRGLPLPDAGRLVSFWTTFENQPGAEFELSQAEFADLRSEAGSLELAGGWGLGEVAVEPMDDAPARVADVAYTVGDIYRLVGARTVLGRLPGEADDRVGAAPVVLLSHALWRQQFGGDPSVVGRDASMFGSPEAEIIGVLAPDVALPGDACGGSACASAPDLWVHWVQDPADWADTRSGHGMRVAGRLRAGATIDGLRSELASLEQEWAVRYAGQHGFGIDGHALRVMSLDDRVLGQARRVALLLGVAAGLLLALTCANVANLLLARGESRSAEVGVRIALGASPGRVARPVLVEGILLALAGCAAGLLLATLGMPQLLRLAPPGMQGVEAVDINARAVLFATGVALLTGIVFAMAPAWISARRDAAQLLRASGRGRTRTTRGLRLLVAGQTALATLLLAGAALLTRSLLELNRIDPGLEVADRVAFAVRLSPIHHEQTTAVVGFYDEAVRRVEALSGVSAAAIVRTLPLRDAARRENVLREGDTEPSQWQGVMVQAATAGVLDALGVPLLEGRDIAAADRADQPPVALVNAAAARVLWPGQQAVGRRFRALFMPESHGLITVVGVYGDVRTTGVASAPQPEIILPVAQLGGGIGWARTAVLVAHATAPVPSLAPQVVATLAQLDPRVPVENPTTMRDVLRANTARERFLGALVGVFAIMALVIAAVGVYAVVAYTVARQSREFAIRHALGAARSSILGGVVRASALVAAAGALAGAVAVLIAAPALRAFLFGVAPRDVLVLTAVPLVLVALAALSALPPALRATRIAPAHALQQME